MKRNVGYIFKYELFLNPSMDRDEIAVEILKRTEFEIIQKDNGEGYMVISMTTNDIANVENGRIEIERIMDIYGIEFTFVNGKATGFITNNL